jgi:hypothetical protein
MRRDEQEPVATIRDVRCACTVCGAHVLAWEGHDIHGWCSVCGSYELTPLASDHSGLGNELVLWQQPVLHREQARRSAA